MSDNFNPYDHHTTPRLQFPLIHNNGSAPVNLTEPLSEAIYALNDAIAAIRQCAPNARDYYPIGDGAYERAAKEHNGRLSHITNAWRDLTEIYGNIETQTTS